jgi:hypothetical protein
MLGQISMVSRLSRRSPARVWCERWFASRTACSRGTDFELLHTTGYTDSAALRNCPQPCVVRVEHVDQGSLARSLSGGMTSTSQSAVASTSGRWLKQERARIRVDVRHNFLVF